MKNKPSVNRQLMKMGEQAFWDEFEKLTKAEMSGERYIVWDGKKRQVVVFGAKLVRDKMKGRA